jgi:putative spermidine/putrescine transport system substrate-binding protein
MRRIGASVLAGAFLLAASAGLLDPAPAHGQQVTVVHYGGTFGQAMRKAFFDPAEKELGIKIIDTSRTDMAKIKAMVQSGNIEWDVANVNTLEVGRGARENLWERIDWSVIDPRVAGPIGKLDHGVAFIGFSIGLGYNTKKYPSPDVAPKTWADFWDLKKFPGPRALEDRVRYQLEFALLADGVAPDKLYPLDVDRAFRKLDQIKPHIVAWAKPPVQPIELITSGEVLMASTFNNEVANAQKRGAPIAMQFDGALYLTNAWTVLRGTRNRDLAMKFIKTVTQPAYEARLAEAIYFGPINPDAIPLISSETRRNLPTEPQNLARSIRFDNEWWAENEARLIERWNKWKLQ